MALLPDDLRPVALRLVLPADTGVPDARGEEFDKEGDRIRAGEGDKCEDAVPQESRTAQSSQGWRSHHSCHRPQDFDVWFLAGDS